MTDTPHDHVESADTSPSRPDDPERGNTNQCQPDADVLLGAKRIAEHLTEILGVPVDETDVYYIRRMGKLPIGKYGSLLIASRSRLLRRAEELALGLSSPA
jgi:hypothetical protein